MQKTSKAQNFVDLKTVVKLGFQELTPAELSMLTKDYGLKKDTHKFVKVIHKHPVTNAVEFRYYIKEKDHNEHDPAIEVEEPANATPNRSSNQVTKDSSKDGKSSVFDIESNREIRVDRQDNKKKDTFSGKYSTMSRSIVQPSPSPAKPPSNPNPVQLTAANKAKAVEKQVKQKEQKARVEEQARSKANVFENSPSQTSFEKNQFNTAEKSKDTACFNDANSQEDFNSPIKINPDWSFRGVSFVDDLNREVPEEQPDPEVLTKVSKVVELLSELHAVEKLAVVRLWLDLKDLDKVKIHLANTCKSCLA